MYKLNVKLKADFQVYCTTLLNRTKLVFKWDINSSKYSFGVR